MKIFLWRGAGYDGLGILFLGWLYGSSLLKFDWIAWTLIAIGVVLIAVAIFFRWRMIVEILKGSRFKLTVGAMVVLFLVIGIVGMLNFISVRHSWRVDMTTQKKFSLSDQTINILRNLKTKVTLTAFVDESQTLSLEDRLKEYKHYSGKFSYEIIDPIKEPDRVREFFGPEKKYLDLPTVVLKSEYKEEQLISISEEDVTNALIKVTRDKKKKVYFTRGHGEKEINPAKPGMDSYKFIKDNLITQNFEVEEISLYQKNELFEDANVLVVAGPVKSFARNEVRAVGKFLNRGGSLLAMLDPETKNGLDSILTAWNIKANQDLVLETHSSFILTSQGLDRQSSVSVAPASAEYGEHPITKNFRYATSFIKAQSLKVIERSLDSIQVTPLIYTSRSSWGEKNLKALYKEGWVSQDPEDNPGPVILAVSAEKSGGKGRLLVVGDSDFASDAYSQQAPGNMDLFLNMVSWLAEEEDLISIRPKNPENRPLEMTLKQQKLTLFFLVILLPLLAARWGIYVYKKRS